MQPSFGRRRLASRVVPPSHSQPQSTLGYWAAGNTTLIWGVALVSLLVAVAVASARAPLPSSAGFEIAPTSSVPPQPGKQAPSTPNDKALAKHPVVSPITLCKARYTLDYAMRDTCIRSQEEAKLEAASIRIDEDVQHLCAKRYPDDWSMYVVCAKSQMAAKLPAIEKPDRPRFDIQRKCHEQWPNDYRMQDYCIRQQESAQSRALGGWIEREVAIKCTTEWPHDWSMFMYCVDDQLKARKRRL